jgi:cAMP-dependent protein kinase regulator
MSRKEIQREYLRTKVNPLIERMVTDLLVKMPDNVIGFMKTWLESREEKEHAQTKDPNFEVKVAKAETKDDLSQNSEEEPEDEKDNFLVPKEQLVQKNKHKNSRTSVSAEVYGKFNQKADFKPKVIPKSEEQKERIKTRLSQAFMFSALDDNEQGIVIDAMEEKVVQPGEYVIKQGESGNDLYVVDSGKLACSKLFADNADSTFLKNYEPGDSFGELALLYNAPRAATIVASEESVLFVLDRETFNHIVKDATVKKRQEYEEFLASVEILSSLDAYERSKIADAVKRIKFPPGAHVCTQGEKGDTLYFVEEGEAYVTKTISPDEPAKEFSHYKAGSYFGELALLYDVPRQANVIAKTELKVVALDRMSFKRILGPLETILQRNSQSYENLEKLIV